MTSAPSNSRHRRKPKSSTSPSSASSGSSSLATALAFIVCLTLLPHHSLGYNIDLPSYVRHTREPNTMFGFSIALHRGKSGYPQSNSLVVGAPKQDTSRYQTDVTQAGAVFRCSMNDNDCSLVRFDSKGNNVNNEKDKVDTKSRQWLGATVATSRDNDFVVACAPRYVFHTMSPKKTLRYDPVGTCFTTRNFTDFKEISPCRTNYWGYHRQGSCQAGFSAAASRNGDRLYIGAPGSWYWQGQAYSISSDATFKFKPEFYQPFGTGGQTYSYDVTRPENQVFSTAESSFQDDDSYLGYSMTTGDFNGDRVDDVAIGMPRGEGLLGKIVVNSWNMANIFNLTGTQIGEYFGYALATSDVNGDGLDDLIIGAPMYSDPANVEGKYDVGRVYILLQQANTMKDAQIREGYNTKGRFGLALTTLGDINRDGYGDFAVGAPYDGPEGRGVVYIFHGSAKGPLEKPSQIIRSEDLVDGAPFPRTFGFALAGGLDMDGNTYPDLAIGAYGSDQVFIFKSRPVAAVNAMTSFLNPSKLINIEEKNCQWAGKNVSCTSIMTCWSYTGEYLPGSLEFDVSWVLDSKKLKTPRMHFREGKNINIRNQTISLAYGRTYCRNETIYLAEDLQDKLTPLEVETRYNLRSAHSLAPAIRRRREALEPVIDQNREIVQHDTINIQKNCGDDNICEPDLRLHLMNEIDKYLLGSREPLTLEILISNANEDAFEAAFYMTMPKDLDYKKVQQIGETPISCSAPSESNNYTLKCNLGNPFQSKNVAHFKVVLLPSHKVGMAPSYDFFMVANSTNVEKEGTEFDNTVKKSISIWVETDLEIEGTSQPDFQFYKASEYQSIANATKEEDLGPQVVHIYNIRNNGTSTIEEAIVFIYYPYETAAGDLLMYMTNQPETYGNIQCDPHVNVNSRNLKLDANLVHKSYLEQRGVIVRTYGGAAAASGYSGGHIEKSEGGSASVATGVNDIKVLSVEEEKRLKKEDEQDVSGDASFIHNQRANEAAAEANVQTGSGSGGSWATSSSWNSTSGGRGPSVIVSTKNTTTHYDAYGQPHVVESSTEYVRSLDRSPNYYSQQHSANYQQTGGAGGAGGGGGGGVTYQANIQTQLPQETVHSTHVNQQMASPGRDASSYQQSYTGYSNPGSTSRGAYRPQQQYSTHQSVGGSPTYNELGGSANSGLEKVAQGGRGFQAGLLDVGTLNRANVDNELRSRGSNTGSGPYGYQQSYSTSGNVPQGGASYHQSSSSGGQIPATRYQQSSYSSGLLPQGGANYRQTYSSSAHSPQSGGSYHQSSSGHSGGSGKPYYGLEDEEYYDEENAQQGGEQQQQWSRTSSSATHHRVRREGEEQEAAEVSSHCKAAKCELLRCVAKNLGKDDGAWIAIRMRMVAETMEKLASNVPLNVSTMAKAYVTKLPFIGKPKEEIIKTHEIFYKAIPEPIPVPDVVPLWVVVLAACAGALILLLLVFLLYKCGFFKRNRPTDHSMERQPLRNGYHGDEHL